VVLANMGAMGPLSDEALFERFRGSGDVGAVGELFDRAAPALMRIALHLARDPAAAEDLVQATFLKAIEARAAWEGGRAVMPWLCGILQNRARSMRRVEERAPDPARLPLPASVDPARVAEVAEFDAAVDAAIAALPETYQTVLRLHLAYGHAPGEIAHALSRPPGTVRSQLARGLELLRKTLPVGITGTLALSLSAGRGLAAVRECVLVHAAAVAPLSPIVGSLAAGALAMKTMVSVLGLLVLAGLTWFAWPREEGSLPREVAQASGSESSAAIFEPEALPADPAADTPPQRVALVDPPAVSTGALRIACRWEDDGSLASGVTLTAEPWELRGGELRSRTAVTGGDGSILMADLPASNVRVSADRGGSSTVVVVAGLTVETELMIPRGVNVQGRVVDEEGAPVPLAQIWLSIHARNFSDGRYVTTADANGRFALRSVEPGRFVSAAARGRRAAVVEPVEGEPGSTAEMELVLHGRGTSLLGIVVDPAGRPVAGARVVVGVREMHMEFSRGIHGESRPPPELETNERGEFRADGLEPGSKTALWVRAPEYCTWFRRVDLAPDADTSIAVQLQRGTTVSGRATDDEGNPVEKAGIEARSTAWSSWSNDLNDLGAPDWVFQGALTDADGYYEISTSTPGTLLMRATTRGRTVRGEVPAADGERVTWNPVLVECVIFGRLIDARGMPLVGWEVMGSPPRGEGGSVGDTTDEEGRFRWERCADVPYRLHAYADNDGVRARPFSMFGVLPGTTELLIQVPDDTMPSAAIEGSFLDSDGQPGEKAEVRCVGEGLYYEPRVDVDPNTGRFRIAPLPAGTYRLQGSIDSGDTSRRSAWTEPITLQRNETHDAGLLQMPETGSVSATVYGPDGALLDDADTSVGESFGWGETFWVGSKIERGNLHIADLAPGVYRIMIRRGDLPSSFHEVTVASGEETELEIHVPGGMPCRFHFSSITEPAPMNFTFAWTRDGAPWERYINTWETTGEHSYSTPMQPGSYEVTVTSETGKQATTRFVLKTSDPADREVWITMP
jgi:RNA polymerase sigma-70 factor (ECF subfamily)